MKKLARHAAALAAAVSFALAAAVPLTLSPAATAASPSAHAPAEHKSAHPHWTYSGETGPDHWGDLDPAFATCKAGHTQSPIDIPAATIKPSPLDPIGFDYKAAPLRVVDNGHTVMATY